MVNVTNRPNIAVRLRPLKFCLRHDTDFLSLEDSTHERWSG
jgi:hypothetical protein